MFDTSKVHNIKLHELPTQGSMYIDSLTTQVSSAGVPTSRVLERMWEVPRGYMKLWFSDYVVGGVFPDNTLRERRLRTF